MIESITNAAIETFGTLLLLLFRSFLIWGFIRLCLDDIKITFPRVFAALFILHIAGVIVINK